MSNSELVMSSLSCHDQSTDSKSQVLKKGKLSHLNNPKVSNKRNFASFISDLLQTSSMYVVLRIGLAKTLGRKLFWVLIFILCISICSYDIFRFLQLYFKYPVLIDYEKKTYFSLEFPAVTVCNFNRVKNMFKDCVERGLSWENCLGEESERWINRPQGKTIAFSERLHYTSQTQRNDFYRRKAQAFFKNYTRLNDDDRRFYGHQLQDLIIACSFQSIACNEIDFTYFQSIQYGNCFTFNARTYNDENILRTSQIGASGGLELILNIQDDDYLDITKAEGVRVVIHEPNEDPNPEDDGINISPGFETHIALDKISHERLPYPYRDCCISYGNSNHSTIGKNRFDCARMCMQKIGLSICECVDPFLPDYGWNHCDLQNKTEMDCLDHVLQVIITEQIDCECPLPCSSTIYRLHTFFSKLLNAGVINANYFSSIKRKVRDITSVAKLKVFYRNLDHIIYSQKPMFSDTELFSYLGCVLSLWLGMSFIAVYGCFENIFLFLKYICQSKVIGK